MKEKSRLIKADTIKAAIVQSVETEKENISVENFTAKNNMLTARVKKEGEESLLMHSAYNPEKEADNIISNLDFSRHGLFLVFGIGLGYHVRKILERVSSKSIIIVIEQSQIIYDNFLKNINTEFLLGDPRVAIIKSINPQNIAIALEALSRKESIINTFSHNIQYMELNYHKVLFKGIAAAAIKEIAEIAIIKRKMFGNCHVDHNIGVIQPILNIDEIIDNAGIEKMKKCYEGESAIIVSAGPSLDKNIKYLSEAKGKILIVAVDAVLPKLLKNNIIPDVVVTVERLSVYNNILKKMDREIPKSVVLVAPALTEVNTLKVFKRNHKIFFFQKGVSTQTYYDEIIGKGLMESGTSAAYTALSFCYVLGFKKIAFIGQDLAYSEDGKIYSEGISKEGNTTEEERKKNPEYLTTVKDYNGNEILSNIIWKGQLTTFKLFIKLSPSIKVYDATEGGAIIDGAEIITLEQYIKENGQNHLEDINVIIERNKDNLGTPKESIIRKLLQKLSKDYKSFFKLQTTINAQFENLLESNQKYVIQKFDFSKEEMQKNVELIRNSQQITDEIIKFDFLKLYYQGLIATFRKDVNEIAEKDFLISLREHIRIHYEFFEILKPIFKLNMSHIEFVLKFLEAKLKNESPNDDIIEIIREIVKANDIDPEFIYYYFGIKK